jgi:hypothetical protein
VTLIMDRYRPLRGASSCDIELPRWFKSTKTCINVANADQLCFGYAIASSETVRLKPDARDLNRVAKHAGALATLDLRGICTADDAAKCSQASFRKFEAQNSEYALLVFSTEQASAGRDLAVQYISPNQGNDAYRQVALVFIEASDPDAPGHYVWCMNPRTLLGNATANGHCGETCLRCLSQFAGVGAAERLAVHKGICDRAAGDSRPALLATR